MAIRIIRNYLQNRSGQYSVVFALVLSVLLLAAGGATDVAGNLSAKRKIQLATDNAALAGASYVFLQKQSSQDLRADVIKRATETFWENCQGNYCRAPKITFDNGRVDVKATGNRKNLFLSIFGSKSWDLATNSVAVTAHASTPENIDIHFLFDVSSSMMFPDTQAGVNLMQANFSPFGAGGCAFACHLKTGPASGDQVAQSLGVYLREDRMRDEIQRISNRVLDKANGNVRISLISFGTTARELVRHTTQKAAVTSGLTKSDYVETANGTGTNYEIVFPEVVSKGFIPSKAGDGSTKSPHSIVVLITDGVYSTHAASTSGAVADKAINPTSCDVIKKAGSELYVLNLDYPHPSTLLTTGANAMRLAALEGFHNNIDDSLKSCASEGRYFKGKFSSEIIDAFDVILDDILKDAESTESTPRLVH